MPSLFLALALALALGLTLILDPSLIRNPNSLFISALPELDSNPNLYKVREKLAWRLQDSIRKSDSAACVILHLPSR